MKAEDAGEGHSELPQLFGEEPVDVGSAFDTIEGDLIAVF